MERSNILTCSCSCFSKDSLIPNLTINDYDEHIKVWKEFLSNFKKEICKHRSLSIFNLPCGNKTSVSVGVFKDCLLYAKHSFDVLKNFLDLKNLNQYVIFLTVKENPMEAGKYVELMLNHITNQYELLSYTKSSDEPLSFDYCNRYFVMHNLCLSVLEDVHRYGNFFEDFINQLEEYTSSSSRVCEDRRTIAFEDFGT